LFTLHALTSDDLASAGLSEEEELYGWRVLDCSNRDTLYYQVSFIFPGFEEGEPPWLLLGYITGSRQYFRAEDYLAGTRPPVYSTREAEEVFSRLAKVGDYLSVQSGGDQWKKIFDRKEYFGGNACGLCLVSPDGRYVVYEWCSDWLEGCDYVPFLIELATKKYRPLTGAGTFHWLSSDRLIYKKYKSGNYDAIYEVRGLELEPEILVDSIYDFILVRQ
jgi:hypothetical protein